MEVLMSAVDFYRTVSLIVIGGLMFVILVMVALSYLYHKDIKGSDFPEWFSLAFFFISFLDFATDIVFFGDLTLQGDSFALYTALFSFVPHVVSFMICIGFIFRWRYCMDPPPNNYDWIKSHSIFLVVVSFFSRFLGGVEFANCKIFHLQTTNMQIMDDQKDTIALFHLIINLCFGQFPLLVIQVSYIWLLQFQEISMAALSLVFTFTSILIGILFIVPKLCNQFFNALGFACNHHNNNNNNNDDDDDNDNENGSPQSLADVYILMSITCSEFQFFTHHLYAHNLVASAWDRTLSLLAIAYCDIKCVYITRDECGENEMKFKIRFQREIYDESLDLHLSMLQTADAGLEHDILREQISQSLVLNGANGLEIKVYRASKFSMLPPSEADPAQAQAQAQQGGQGPDLNRKATEQINEEKKWKCVQCTFENHFLLENCEVCQAEKPEASQVSQPAVAAAAAGAVVNGSHKDAQPPPALIEDAMYIELQQKSKSREQDIMYSPEQKMLLQSIEKDNKQFALVKPSGDGGGLWTGDLVVDEDDGGRNAVVRGGSDDEDDDVVLQGMNINTAGDEDDNDAANMAVVVAPPDDDDDSKQPELEPFDDMNELFDNRYTNDGLNDDFDDLAQPDVFG